MKIPIYSQEIKDGLGEKIIASQVIPCFSPVKPAKLQKTVSPAILAKITASLNKQPDLFYMEDIITRTGWNKNDDVFLTAETWKARNSCEDKPLDLEHDTREIIGHITGQMAITTDGQSIIADDTSVDELPEQFDILNSSVIYLACWDSDKYTEKIAKIVEEIQSEDNPWGVSLEVLATDFGYAVQEKNGKQHLLARNSKTAFLTKYLRTYGGVGEYQGCKIGRTILNFIFSGKGLTKNPANDNSVINPKTNISVFASVDKFVCRESTDSYKFPTEIEMDELNKQLEQVKAELKSANDKNSELVTANKNLTSEVTSLKETVSVKDKEIVEVKANLDKVNASLGEIKEKQEKSERVAAVVAQLDFSNDEADKVYAGILKGLTNEQFKSYLELTPKKVKAEKVEASATKVLETAVPLETPATVPNADTSAKVVASMTEFFSKTSNKKTK